MEVTSGQIYGSPCASFFFPLVSSLSCPGFTGGNHMALHKHLSLEERFFIANQLDRSASFKSIALELNRDCTTVSKEIRSHKIFKKTGAHGRAFNNCALRFRCDRRRLCTPCYADVTAGPAKSVSRSARISWRKNAPGFPGRLTSATAART